MRRILGDECVNPRLAPRIRSSLPQFSVDTVRDPGWAGQKDHVLIPRIEGRYDVFLTIDKGFEFEHNLKQFSFGIIVLTTANNQMPSYERLLEELARQIQLLSPGQAVHVIDPER
jgi:predicted nuclease of predicted toxin-antitoxin system